jgi:hypothetical protein
MDAGFFCGLPLLNAFLVALCWVPPIVSRRAKIALLLVFLGSLASCWVDAVGRDLHFIPALLASLATLVLALLTLLYVFVRVQLNHARREPLDERPEEAPDDRGPDSVPGHVVVAARERFSRGEQQRRVQQGQQGVQGG